MTSFNIHVQVTGMAPQACMQRWLQWSPRLDTGKGRTADGSTFAGERRSPRQRRPGSPPQMGGTAFPFYMPRSCKSLWFLCPLSDPFSFQTAGPRTGRTSLQASPLASLEMLCQSNTDIALLTPEFISPNPSA